MSAAIPSAQGHTAFVRSTLAACADAGGVVGGAEGVEAVFGVGASMLGIVRMRASRMYPGKKPIKPQAKGPLAS